MKELSEELSSDIIGATIQAVEAQEGPSIPWSVSTNCSSIQTCPAVPTITPLSVNVIKDAQTNDQDISPVYECKLSGTKPKVRQLKTYSLKTKCLFREWGKLTINQDGILCRATFTRTQLVLPENYKGTVLQSFTMEWAIKVQIILSHSSVNVSFGHICRQTLSIMSPKHADAVA